MKPWFLIALLALCACAKAPDEDKDQAAGSRQQVLTIDLTSEPYRLQAVRWIRDVRQAHLEADRLAEAGEGEAALALLKTTLDQQPPIGVGFGHRQTMRRDLYGHAARLALALKRNDEASRSIAAGLAIDESGDDPFHTQLLFLAVELAQAQKDPRAEAAAQQALRAALASALE
jgi:hypothetical protein